MRLLVTGASGLLGASLALQAASRYEVVGTANQHGIKSFAFQVRQLDLLAPGALENLLDQVQPDWVIHCAAMANLEACEKDPEMANKVNAELPAWISRAVSRSGARMVHVSTDAVFDGERGLYREEDEPNPLSVYARSKLAGEQAVQEANPEALIARVNLFGWSITGKRSLAEFFYNNLRDGKRVNGFTDVFFCPLLVNDLAELFFEMLERKLSGLYHVFSPECTSKFAFGVAIARLFGLDESLINPVSVSQGELRARRSPNLRMCTDKLSNALGHPLPTWQEGLNRLAELYQQGYPRTLHAMLE